MNQEALSILHWMMVIERYIYTAFVFILVYMLIQKIFREYNNSKRNRW
jgi:hypothetical protein